MSTVVTFSLGQRAELLPRPAAAARRSRRDREVHSSSGVCGVGPAESTGKSSVTYWPGGTRSRGASLRDRPEATRDWAHRRIVSDVGESGRRGRANIRLRTDEPSAGTTSPTSTSSRSASSSGRGSCRSSARARRRRCSTRTRSSTRSSCPTGPSSGRAAWRSPRRSSRARCAGGAWSSSAAAWASRRSPRRSPAARVLATDWSPTAIALLEENARRNAVRLETAIVAWAHPDALVERAPWDLVLAADVLYERRNVDELLELLPRLGSRSSSPTPADLTPNRSSRRQPGPGRSSIAGSSTRSPPMALPTREPPPDAEAREDEQQRPRAAPAITSRSRVVFVRGRRNLRVHARVGREPPYCPRRCGRERRPAVARRRQRVDDPLRVGQRLAVAREAEAVRHHDQQPVLVDELDLLPEEPRVRLRLAARATARRRGRRRSRSPRRGSCSPSCSRRATIAVELLPASPSGSSRRTARTPAA